MNNVKELVDSYTAIWNESDAERRRRGIAEIWSEDAVQLLHPPEEADAPASLPVRAIFEVRGRAELEARVTRAYEEFVATEGNSVRPQDPGTRVADGVKWRWEMVTGEGEVAATGLQFVILGADDRIEADYQFIES